MLFCTLPLRMIQHSLMTYFKLKIKILINTFKVFSLFSGLKVSWWSKREIAGLGSLKMVLEAVCAIKSINVTANTIKMLGFCYSYNSTLKVQNKFLDTEESIQ